jgi:HEAT repeat protein
MTEARTLARGLAKEYGSFMAPSGNLLSEAQEGDAETTRTVITELISLLGDSSANTRVGAAEVLGLLAAPGDVAVEEALTARLTDTEQRDYSPSGFYADEDDMRTPGQMAAEALAKLRSVLAVEPLCAIALDRKCWPWNRIAAVRALTVIGDQRAVEVLRQLLDDKEVHRWGVYGTQAEVSIADLAHRGLEKLASSTAVDAPA